MTRVRLCLMVAVAVVACRDEPDRSRAALSDTIAPIGTGTELLLTRERIELIDSWLRGSLARRGTVPESLEELRPPEADAERYVPLERFLRDGWGRAIEYKRAPDRRSYELRSAGEDGVAGTVDDITLKG